MGQMLKAPRVAVVVEDDLYVRFLAVALLEETDLRVQEASSAEEALQYLRDHAEEVALLFTDVRLPCLMSGVDLALNGSPQMAMGSHDPDLLGSPGRRRASVPREVRFMPKPWRALDALVEAERVVRTARLKL